MSSLKRFLCTISVRVFYPASSLSIMLLVYAANNVCELVDFLPKISYLGTCNTISGIIDLYTNNCIVKHAVVYLSIVLIIAMLLWLATRFENLSKDTIDEEYSIDNLEPAERNYMPIYLSYFFVALSFKTIESLCIGFAIFYVLSYVTKVMSFNPLLLLMGYRFLNLKNTTGKQIMIVVKKENLTTSRTKFENLRRINDYTFYYS